MYGSSHKSTNNNTRPSPDVYTQKVADHYKLKHYNFSDPGASNQSIAKQVFIATQFEKENNLKPIYWIGWTKYKHLGLCHPIAKNIVAGWPYIDVQSELSKNSGSKLTQEWAKKVYLVIDKLSRFVLSLNTILQVNGMLSSQKKITINTFNSSTWSTKCKPSSYYIRDKNKKIESLVEQWMESHTKQLDENYKNTTVIAGKSGDNYKNFDPYLDALWKEIKKFTWFEWNDNDPGFQLWVRQNNLELYSLDDSTNPDTWHPKESAHIEASKKIINSAVIKKVNNYEMV